MFLRLLKLRQFGGIIGSLVRIEFDLADRRARFGDFRERGFFKVGRTRNRRHQVGNQVRAALVNILDLGPLLVHFLRTADQAVVDRTDAEVDDQETDGHYAETPESQPGFFHSDATLPEAGLIWSTI